MKQYRWAQTFTKELLTDTEKWRSRMMISPSSPLYTGLQKNIFISLKGKIDSSWQISKNIVLGTICHSPADRRCKSVPNTNGNLRVISQAEIRRRQQWLSSDNIFSMWRPIVPNIFWFKKRSTIEKSIHECGRFNAMYVSLCNIQQQRNPSNWHIAILSPFFWNSCWHTYTQHRGP